LTLRRRLVAVGAALGLAVVAGQVLAASHADMQVSAQIVDGCEVASSQWGRLDYGTHAALHADSVATSLAGAVQIRCTPGLALSMQVDGGLHGRQLQRDGGNERIAYQLFTDAARSALLPIDQPVAVSLGLAGAVTLPIHAELRVPAQMPAGTYSDVLQVQLIW
jgi:spore coat protein U-like protein